MRKRKLVVKNKRFRDTVLNILLVLFAFLGIGYATLQTTLNIDGSLSVSKIDLPYLYDVLKDAYTSGSYAQKYIGAHHDSFIENPSKNIYYWYASNDTEGTAILDKNNVIFAGHCWQMIRTTDTGGVKMIYNGEADNNQCLDTRSNHVGYNSYEDKTMNGNYWYGTDYQYDQTNNLFSLSGTLEQKIWNLSNASSLIGTYTCMDESSSGTCSSLSLIHSYIDSSTARVIILQNSSHYSQYGIVPYNEAEDSLGYVGYMYNSIYRKIVPSFPKFHLSDGTISSNYNNCYFSDTIDYGNLSPGNYTLVNPSLISSVNYRDLEGKFFMMNSLTSGSTVYYITSSFSTSLTYRELSNGDMKTSLTVGDSYSYSNGIYTLTNPQTISYAVWADNGYNNKKNYYVCDGSLSSCSHIMHISPVRSDTSFTYIDNSLTYKYAEDVTYNNGVYTLSGDIKTIWDIYDDTQNTYISTHHYTCLDDTTSCASVMYVNKVTSLALLLTELTGGVDIEEAMNEMLYDSNVNEYDSFVKFATDAWYKKYLLSYDQYIEDTVFCNNKDILSLGSWDPNGGDVLSIVNIPASPALQFKEYSPTTDLSCSRNTDKFSISNNSAKLTYKVGLMTSSEMNLLNNANARKSGKWYWLMSPWAYDSLYYLSRFVDYFGTFNTTTGGRQFGVRPAISLAPGAFYLSGDGSKANPYIISTN